MPTNSSRIDFEAKQGDKIAVRQMMQSALEQAKGGVRARREQWKDEYSLYQMFIAPGDLNPERANVFIPKIWQIIQTKHPRILKALVGARPYLPLTTPREDEFGDAVQIYEEIVDEQLHKAGFVNKVDLLVLLAACYGTAFIDAVPRYIPGTDSTIINDGFQNKLFKFPVERLCFDVTVYAPWEILPDKFAKGLEDPRDCRYVIKRHPASKRGIVKAAMQGAYPGLDLDKFQAEVEKNKVSQGAKEFGQEMLDHIGLSNDGWDDDIGVILRMETPDRYTDMWVTGNGDAADGLVIRDVQNPFFEAHGGINLSRLLWYRDAHTNNQFWGAMGEIKPNEILQEILNDTMGLTLDSHEFMKIPIIYHDSKISKNSLKREIGNTVSIDRKDGGKISDYIMESSGQSLPSEHYALQNYIDLQMDRTSGSFSPSRGEPSEAGTTATEVIKLDQAGDEREELTVIRAESLFLQDFGKKMVGMVTEFMELSDMVEVIGSERASLAIVGNLRDFPGGYNMTFKGSGQVVNELVKQRNWIRVMEMLNGNPNVLMGWLAEKTMEIHGFTKDFYEEGIVPDQMMMEMQMISEQQAQEREFMAASLSLPKGEARQKLAPKASGNGTAPTRASGDQPLRGVRESVSQGDVR